MKFKFKQQGQFFKKLNTDTAKFLETYYLMWHEISTET